MADDRPSRPTLADVLGAMASSLTRARVAADLTALQAARMYHQNELLRGMPVPRVRIRKVAIDLPIVVEEIQAAVPPALGEPSQMANAAMDKLRRASSRIDDALQVASLGGAHSASLQQFIDVLKTVRDLFNPAAEPNPEAPLLQTRLSTPLQSALQFELEDLIVDNGNQLNVDLVRGRVAERTVDTLQDFLYGWLTRSADRSNAATLFPPDLVNQVIGRREVSTALLTPEQKSSLLSLAEVLPAVIGLASHAAADAAIAGPGQEAAILVTAETEHVRATGTANAITRLSMVLSEEGLEWTAEKGDAGSTNWKLTPE